MSVHNIKNKEKIPQPLFRVEITFESSKLKRNEPHPIYNLRYLLHRRITVEEPRKRKDPPQCLNCQEFGHTKSYCKLPAAQNLPNAQNLKTTQKLKNVVTAVVITRLIIGGVQSLFR